MSTRQDIERRRTFWRAEVAAAAKAVDEWWNKNQRWQFERSADTAAENAQKFLQRALSLLAAGEFGSVGQMDSRIKPLVDGAYLQVSSAAPQWSEPVKESVNDVKSVATTALTWGSGGAGFAFVVGLAAWLWWTKGH